MVVAMRRIRDAKFGGFADLAVRAWRRLAEPARTRRVEEEVRFEQLKGLVK